MDVHSTSICRSLMCYESLNDRQGGCAIHFKSGDFKFLLGGECLRFTIPDLRPWTLQCTILESSAYDLTLFLGFTWSYSVLFGFTARNLTLFHTDFDSFTLQKP